MQVYIFYSKIELKKKKRRKRKERDAMVQALSFFNTQVVDFAQSTQKRNIK